MAPSLGNEAHPQVQPPHIHRPLGRLAAALPSAAAAPFLPAFPLAAAAAAAAAAGLPLPPLPPAGAAEAALLLLAAAGAAARSAWLPAYRARSCSTSSSAIFLHDIMTKTFD